MLASGHQAQDKSVHWTYDPDHSLQTAQVSGAFLKTLCPVSCPWSSESLPLHIVSVWAGCVHIWLTRTYMHTCLTEGMKILSKAGCKLHLVPRSYAKLFPEASDNAFLPELAGLLPLTRAYPKVSQGWLFLDSSIHGMSHGFWKGYRVIYHLSRHLKGIFKMPNVCSLSDWVSFCTSFPLYLTPRRGLLWKLPPRKCKKLGYDPSVLLQEPGWCGWPVYSPSLIYLHLRTWSWMAKQNVIAIWLLRGEMSRLK